MADLRRFGAADFGLLVIVLALAGGARAGYLITCCDSGRSSGHLRVEDPRPSFAADGQTDLEQLVENLRSGNRFESSSPLDGAVGNTAHTSPGYPWTLGLLARVVNRGGDFDKPTRDELERYVRWGQCGLGTLTAGLYFLFARRAFGSLFVATLAGIFCAVHPFWVIDTATIEDGVLASFFLAAVMFFGVRGVQTSGALSSLLYGLLLAALALTRAALLPFSAVAFLWFLLRCRNVPQGWLCGLLAFLGFVIGLTPWTYYNWERFNHDVIPVVDSQYIHLWEGNNPRATGGPPSNDDLIRLRLIGNPVPRQRRLSEVAYAVEKELGRDQVVAVNRRITAGLDFFFGESWFRDNKFADELSPADSEPMPEWLARAYPGTLAGSLLGMLILGVLGWRWTFGFRFTAMPSSLAVMWIPVPYILSHADFLSGPRLPLDGVLLCYAAFAVGCILPRLSPALWAGDRPVVRGEVVRTNRPR
jgi:4-amino-4-deoxy-L-arabinose transferase-like glycosyltransferase